VDLTWFIKQFRESMRALASMTLACWLLPFGCALSAWADGAAPTNAPVAPAPQFTLWQSLDLALKQNPDVLIARKRLEEAAGGVIEARAGFLPSLTTWDNYERFQDDYATLNGVMPNQRSEIWNVSVRLTETAYAGGSVRGRMSIARLNQQSSLLNYQAAVDQVTMDVRVAFYEVLKDKAGIAVHQQAVDFLGKQLQFERQRLEIGSGQKLNVMRADVELSLEQAALIESQNLWRNAVLHLGELLAIPNAPGQPQVSLETTGQLTAPPFSMTGEQCLATAMTHRPELKVRDNDVAVQKNQLVVDRSNLLPHVSVYLGYDVVSEPDRTVPYDYFNGYVAGLGVNWNLFDGFATQGRIQATRARISEAEISQSAIRRSVRAEVVRAYQDLQRAQETMQSQRENADLAEQSQSLATANFGQGLITQLDLLQSQLDLTKARTVELNARFDYNVALAQLQRAMGSQLNISDDREAK
jgi:outer membrane protein